MADYLSKADHLDSYAGSEAFADTINALINEVNELREKLATEKTKVDTVIAICRSTDIYVDWKYETVSWGSAFDWAHHQMATERKKND